MASTNRPFVYLILVVVNVSYIGTFAKSNTVDLTEVKSMKEFYEQRLKNLEDFNTDIFSRFKTLLEDNKRLSTRLSVLESNNQKHTSSCKEEIGMMSDLVQKYDRRISALEKENKDLKGKMKNLLDTVPTDILINSENTNVDPKLHVVNSKQQQEIDLLANLTESGKKQQILSDEVLEHDSTTRTKNIEGMPNRINSVGEKNKKESLFVMTANYPSRTQLKRAGVSGTKSAFSASISHDYHNLGDSQSITFDHVHTNIGNHYNSFTGTYTSPVSGIYVFFLTITTSGDAGLETEIVRNGERVAPVFSADDSNTDFNSGSNTGVVLLHVGDTIFVRIHEKYHGNGIVIDGAYSYFSGFLLYEI